MRVSLHVGSVSLVGTHCITIRASRPCNIRSRLNLLAARNPLCIAAAAGSSDDTDVPPVYVGDIVVRGPDWSVEVS